MIVSESHQRRFFVTGKVTTATCSALLIFVIDHDADGGVAKVVCRAR